MAVSKCATMTPEQIGEHWQRDPRTIRQMLRDGSLRGFKTGTGGSKAQWRVLVSEVERYENGAVANA